MEYLVITAWCHGTTLTQQVCNGQGMPMNLTQVIHYLSVQLSPTDINTGYSAEGFAQIKVSASL
jgi:hypothetical protein